MLTANVTVETVQMPQTQAWLYFRYVLPFMDMIRPLGIKSREKFLAGYATSCHANSPQTEWGGVAFPTITPQIAAFFRFIGALKHDAPAGKVRLFG